ncbi:nucleotide exchange factor GrpE [Gracilinema caldarium]|uniref:Protein GrpE n=1 Tax=Gracilinema caldarium (strain ATCC 51460 / DSM 7334 / H1) TaxID=744872 RepID=F8F147_GRAC1|nr:nucleotide exchange factor GrpE [Gracilinema caldarium]AEJ20837.1 Protein grpE [Gracilinema caldarium DSM 7334]
MSKHHTEHDNHDGKKHAQTQDVKDEKANATEASDLSGNMSGDQRAEGQTEQQQQNTPQSAEAVKAELEAKIIALEAELSELKDQYLRKAAEFENFRKRMQREKQEAIEFANQSLLLDLIPVIDDFERAIKSSEAARDYEALHEGISMIEKRLVSQLETKWGLVRFESAGEPFDPNKHEALMMEQSETVQEPIVGEDLLKGYKLKDRIIRTAKVKVLMPAEQNTAGQNTAEQHTADQANGSDT